jgi:hypothetical protein
MLLDRLAMLLRRTYSTGHLSRLTARIGGELAASRTQVEGYMPADAVPHTQGEKEAQND